jgi:exopolyphosphatase/guanosine-5'-triphosphate,3'-diphosphate pyrophosphatase
MIRYGAIDVGSNAVRLLIADINEHKRTFKKNTLVRVPLRLGDDAFLDKYISDRKASELVNAMSAFRQLMDVFHVEKYMACATSAMREATNGGEVARQVRKKAGIELAIVEGQREASIVYSSHVNEPLDTRKNYLYIDVGGGSTELSLFSEGQPEISRSFNLGTIRILDNQDKEETWNEMRDWIKVNCRKYSPLSGVGTGGNINKLFRLSEEKEGTPLSSAKLKSLYTYLSSYSLKERIGTLGLNADRADVILPACEIYLSVLKWAGIRQMYVPRVGMADGMIQLLIEENLR